jgi:hypothetical protein
MSSVACALIKAAIRPGRYEDADAPLGLLRAGEKRRAQQRGEQPTPALVCSLVFFEESGHDDVHVKNGDCACYARRGARRRSRH